MKNVIKRLLRVCLTEKMYAKISYYHIFKRKLDINKPKTFTEKLWWLKIYNGKHHKELFQLCYDKYTAKQYIGRIVGKEYLPLTYGVYDDVDEIPFDELPCSYVVKITQSSGRNIIVKDKDKISIDSIKVILREWLNMSKKDAVGPSIQRYCFNGNPKIMVEEYLEIGDSDELNIYCFNGEPKLFVRDFNCRNDDGTLKKRYNRNTYDISWNLIPVNLGRPFDGTTKLEKYSNFDEMVDIAKKLSKDFIFVRVDLFNVNGKTYCGELTWIPQGGGGHITPEEYDYQFGEMLNLPLEEQL